MNKNSIIDYSGYILLKVLGPLIRVLPKTFSLFLGRLLGDLFYAFDLKHHALAYANIKTALGDNLSPAQIRKITRKFYRAFGQNFMEIFFIPLIDQQYIQKYISVEGMEHVREALARGKGVIFVAMHAGSWELSNIISANLGFKFSMFVREQKFPRLEKLLNSYRSARGCRFIQRQNELRDLIRVLKANQAVALTIDQGGKNGIGVKFFNKDASMASGAVQLALKYDCSLIPIFPIRVKGSYLKFFIEPAFALKKTADTEQDLRDNLQQLVHIFERYIQRYPQEYLWSYKIWKYSREKKVLLLSDGKAGHLNQSRALAKMVSDYFGKSGIQTAIRIKEVKFKNRFSRLALDLSNLLAGKYICQGCLFCLRRFLAQESYQPLTAEKYDIIISCGASLVGINYVLAKENLAKSIVLMRPAIFTADRFDLIVESEHDSPPKAKNIAVIEGALNLIDGQYLNQQVEELKKERHFEAVPLKLYIGLLIGGDTKDAPLSLETVKEVIAETKKAAQKFNAEILVTTSRRTSAEIEALVKEELKDEPACRLLIIANDKNYPWVVGAILGLSHIVITSAESISMVCEAVSSKKYVLVFGSQDLSIRHKKFIQDFHTKKYIYLSQPQSLAAEIDRLWSTKPAIQSLRNNAIIEAALKKIL